ncbi:uncharacterized protein LOC135365980 [Ornithodoros turicata]
MSKMQNCFADICKFTRAKLRKVDTHVKSLSGQRWVERKDAEGWFRSMFPSDPIGASDAAGFVFDFTPDLQVAEVIPGLYVGSQDVAADKNLLVSRGITHVVNAATFIPNFHEPDLVYKRFEVLDLPDSNLHPLFEPCCDFIDEALSGGGGVLVHCNAGVSRSVSLVVAYLMLRKGMRFANALARVQEVRPVARPNDGFRAQLMELDNRLYGD